MVRRQTANLSYAGSNPVPASKRDSPRVVDGGESLHRRFLELRMDGFTFYWDIV